MPKTDPRIDAYIAKSEPFAQEILHHLRELVHQACPQTEETIKWGFPHFEYKGILCSMASFKQHCAFTFWKGSIMSDPEGMLALVGERTAMGHLGRIQSLKDLPSDDILLRYLAEAIRLNAEGIPLPPKANKGERPELVVPDYFREALSQSPKALATFEAFSYSHKRDYLEWITEAKTEATRQKRIATALEWLTEGKGRNWKHEK